jgi:UDP-3-O-[3-hydroxymyristoyl] N-acetylglucosamine deacetylase
MQQTTLGAALSFEGVGLHTGAAARLEIRPASADAGLFFLLDGTRVPATAEFVVDTSRATVLGRDGKSISTVEHVLSALVGMGIDNAEIAVSGPEAPVLDGSSGEYATAIERVGVSELDRARNDFTVAAPFELRAGDRAVIVLPSNEFRVRFVADFPSPVGTQYFNGAIDARTYRSEIAEARTFGYLHEVEALRARGLALGGSLDNALVFGPDGPMQPLRWPNEVVRHKVLDLIGDFALLGSRPRCEIIAIKSGHEMHAQVTRALRERHRG